MLRAEMAPCFVMAMLLIPTPTVADVTRSLTNSCAAQPEASIATPIGIEFAWIMNGTCGPRSGYRLIAISPAVGGAAGWAGDMVRADH